MPRLLLPDGAQLHYEVCGQGPALVFAHGLGGNHLSWWQQVPAFAPRHTCLTFAHRGFAPSHDPAGTPDPARFAGDLQILLDRLGIGEARLVAQSMGGWTALGLALRQPGRVRAMVLSATTGVADMSGAVDLASWAERAAAERRRLEAADVHAAAGERMAREQPQLHYLYQQISRLSDGLDREALRKKMYALRTVQPEQLASLATPTLCLAGLEDAIVSPDAVRALASTLPNGRFEAFEATGHSPYFERAARFNALVLGFLESL